MSTAVIADYSWKLGFKFNPGLNLEVIQQRLLGFESLHGEVEELREEVSDLRESDLVQESIQKNIGYCISC